LSQCLAELNSLNDGSAKTESDLDGTILRLQKILDTVSPVARQLKYRQHFETLLELTDDDAVSDDKGKQVPSSSSLSSRAKRIAGFAKGLQDDVKLGLITIGVELGKSPEFVKYLKWARDNVRQHPVYVLILVAVLAVEAWQQIAPLPWPNLAIFHHTGKLPTPADVIAHWAGNQLVSQPGAIVADNSGSVTLESDDSGGAFSFDGKGFLSASAAAIPSGSNDRTVEFWFMPTVQPPTAKEQVILFCYGAFAVESEEYCILYSNARGVLFTNWGDDARQPGALAANRWHHVAVTNIGGDVSLYLDGTLGSQQPLTMRTAAGSSLFIGGVPSQLAALALARNNDVVSNFQGRIRDLTIYRVALPPSTIKAIYQNSFEKYRAASANR
jgi:Concanavalin A-like lectin/glucanases superfamily